VGYGTLRLPRLPCWEMENAVIISEDLDVAKALVAVVAEVTRATAVDV